MNTLVYTYTDRLQNILYSMHGGLRPRLTHNTINRSIDYHRADRPTVYHSNCQSIACKSLLPPALPSFYALYTRSTGDKIIAPAAGVITIVVISTTASLILICSPVQSLASRVVVQISIISFSGRQSVCKSGLLNTPVNQLVKNI